MTLTIGSGTNRAIIVCIAATIAISDTTTITCPGVSAFTQVPGSKQISPSGDESRIYVGVAPTPGSQTVNVTNVHFSGDWGMIVVTVAGADQTTPCINGTGTAQGDSNSISTVGVTAVGHLVVDMMNWNTSVTPSMSGGDATQTQLINTTKGGGNTTMGCSTDAVLSGTSATLGWATTGHGSVTQSVVDFQPPAALGLQTPIIHQPPIFIQTW